MRSELAAAPRILGILRHGIDRTKAATFHRMCAAMERERCLDGEGHLGSED